MNWLPIVINFLVAILVIVSLLIIMLVLMQRPKNEGLGAAFGGGMTENLFGAQTTNVLQTATRYLGGLFFALALLISWLYVKKSNTSSTLQQRLSAPTVIPATPAPATPAPDDGVKAPGAVSDPVKAIPATPAPTPGSAPAPAGGEAAKPATPGASPEAPKSDPAPEAAKPAPAPAAPEGAAPAAAKPAPAPAEKPAGKPAEAPAAPEKPAN